MIFNYLKIKLFFGNLTKTRVKIDKKSHRMRKNHQGDAIKTKNTCIFVIYNNLNVFHAIFWHIFPEGRRS